MRRYIEAFLKYRFLLFNLIERDIKVKYRRSFLGLLWSVLNPLMTMVILTTVFSNLFRFQIENFSLYIILGLTMFSFMSDATSTSMSSILGAGPLIKKVYIPKYIFPLEKVLFSFVNLIFAQLAVIIVFLFSNISFKWTMLLFPIPLFYLLFFSIGIGLILSAAAVFFRDMLHLYGVILTAWMYLTPIIYPIEILPPLMQRLMILNPMYYYVDYMRQIMIYNNIPGIKENLTCIAIAFFAMVVGLWIFKQKQDRFILFI